MGPTTFFGKERILFPLTREHPSLEEFRKKTRRIRWIKRQRARNEALAEALSSNSVVWKKEKKIGRRFPETGRSQSN